MNSFHSDAEADFNAKAEALFGMLKPIPAQEKIPGNGLNAYHPVIDITSDSIQDLQEYRSDYLGNITGFIISGKERLGLIDQDHEQLVLLAEKIAKKNPLKGRVAPKTVMDFLHDWLNQKSKNETQEPLCDFLIKGITPLIKNREFIVPIHYLEIQSSFNLGMITFKPMTRDLLDLWQEAFMRVIGPEVDLGEKIFAEKFRRYQGHTAAIFNAETDDSLGKDKAVAEALKSLAVLRVFSPSALNHRMWSQSVLWGTGHFDSEVTLEMAKTGYPHPSSSSVGIPLSPDIFSTDDINRSFKWLKHVHPFLLSISKNTEFAECVIHSLLLYSESIVKKRIRDKLVYIFAALESIFIRQNNEPITQNIAMRIAIFVGKNLNSRREIKRNISDSYRLRSAFVHHGIEKKDDKILDQFMRITWLTMLGLMEMIDQFESKDKFLNSLDDRLLS